MNRLKYILAALCLLTFIASSAQPDETAERPQEEDVNAGEIVMEHISDSYEWHIIKIGKTDVVVPLPVIVYSSRSGWHVFASSKLYPRGTEYEGLRIATEGEYAGKIVEQTSTGEEKRPFDLSVTKTVLALWINSLILIFLVLGCAHWCSHADCTPWAWRSCPRAERPGCWPRPACPSSRFPTTPAFRRCWTAG